MNECCCLIAHTDWRNYVTCIQLHPQSMAPMTVSVLLHSEADLAQNFAGAVTFQHFFLGVHANAFMITVSPKGSTFASTDFRHLLLVGWVLVLNLESLFNDVRMVWNFSARPSGFSKIPEGRRMWNSTQYATPYFNKSLGDNSQQMSRFNTVVVVARQCPHILWNYDSMLEYELLNHFENLIPVNLHFFRIETHSKHVLHFRWSPIANKT